MSQSTKIFVGSLPPGCKPVELRHLFENYGVVVECDVMNRCGFVHMELPEMANTAIAALNATEFKGQIINVEPGRKKDRQGRGDVSRGRGNFMARGRGRSGPGGGAEGGGMLVGFPPANLSNKAKHAATLQLAGAIMEFLNENPTSTGVGRGSNRNGPAGRGGNFRDGFPPRGGRGHGSFVGPSERDSGIRPIRHDSNYKAARETPYSRPDRSDPTGRPAFQYSGGSGGGSHISGRFEGATPHRAGNPAHFRREDDFTNDDYGNVDTFERPNDNWKNINQNTIHGSMDNRQHNDSNNYASGFSGNMDNASNSNNYNAGGQDRRGFALPAEHLQDFVGRQRNDFRNISSNRGDDNSVNSTIFQRTRPADQVFGRGSNKPHTAGGNNYSSNIGFGNNYSSNAGPGNNYSSNVRPGYNYSSHAGPGNNYTTNAGGGFGRGGGTGGGTFSRSENNYNNEFPPLNRGGGRGGMNRYGPRQNMMPNRR